MRIVRRGRDVFGQSTPKDQWRFLRVADERDNQNLADDEPVDIDLCTCTHMFSTHTQDEAACDALIVTKPPFGYREQWRSCPCTAFSPVAG